MEEKELIELIILCWRKHHLDDPAIGWEELTEQLCDGLSNILGVEGYEMLQFKYKELYNA